MVYESDPPCVIVVSIIRCVLIPSFLRDGGTILALIPPRLAHSPVACIDQYTLKLLGQSPSASIYHLYKLTLSSNHYVILTLMPTHYTFVLYTISVLLQYSHRSLWSLAIFNQYSRSVSRIHARYSRSRVYVHSSSIIATRARINKKRNHLFGDSDVIISIDQQPDTLPSYGDSTSSFDRDSLTYYSISLRFLVPYKGIGPAAEGEGFRVRVNPRI
jgi:hypothetical protein